MLEEIKKVEIPVFLNCLVGVRRWDIVLKNDKIFLGSPIVKGCIWEYMKPMKGICLGTSHSEHPSLNSDCGVYAYKSIKPISEYLSVSKGSLYGSVYLWGRVIEHEDGYRAEFAYPKDFQFSGCYICDVKDTNYGSWLFLDHWNLKILITFCSIKCLEVIYSSDSQLYNHNYSDVVNMIELGNILKKLRVAYLT